MKHTMWSIKSKYGKKFRWFNCILATWSAASNTYMLLKIWLVGALDDRTYTPEECGWHAFVCLCAFKLFLNIFIVPTIFFVHFFFRSSILYHFFSTVSTAQLCDVREVRRTYLHISRSNIKQWMNDWMNEWTNDTTSTKLLSFVCYMNIHWMAWKHFGIRSISMHSVRNFVEWIFELTKCQRNHSWNFWVAYIRRACTNTRSHIMHKSKVSNKQ